MEGGGRGGVRREGGERKGGRGRGREGERERQSKMANYVSCLASPAYLCCCEVYRLSLTLERLHSLSMKEENNALYVRLYICIIIRYSIVYGKMYSTETPSISATSHHYSYN